MNTIRKAVNSFRNHFIQPYNVRRISLTLEKGGNEYRFYKRLFSFTLFGGTLLATYFIRQRKSEKSLFKESRVIKEKFGNIQLYEFNTFVLPKEIIELLPALRKFEFKEDDIILTTFPKTGTTWVQEIIYLIMNDLDYNKAKATNIIYRFPFLEWPVPGLDALKNYPSPRLFKTHIPPSLIFHTKSATPKIISIIRNPKDVAVSYFHFARMNNIINFEGDFSEFLELFIRGKVSYAPIFYHYIDILKFKVKYQDSEKVLIISYEDLIRNFSQEVDKICLFLGKPKLDNIKMEKLKSHCSFNSMKNNPSVNYKIFDELGLRKKGESEFLRKGVIGDWKNYFTRIENEVVDTWITGNFGDFFNFVYE